MKKIPHLAAAVLTAALLLSIAGCGGGDGKTHLTFQIWDVAQRDGMQKMCDAYTAEHPDVVIVNDGSETPEQIVDRLEAQLGLL